MRASGRYSGISPVWSMAKVALVTIWNLHHTEQTCQESRALRQCLFALVRAIFSCDGVHIYGRLSGEAHEAESLGWTRPLQSDCVQLCAPKGSRIPVAALKGLCPRPLDDGGEYERQYSIERPKGQVVGRWARSSDGQRS